MAVRGRRREAGYLLLENVLVIFIMSVGALAFIAMMQTSMAAVLKARENASCARAAQTGFARLRNIDFYSLFAVDSSSANYGLWAAYPYAAVLDGVRTTLGNARFDRFRTTVTFMRRDSSDADADGFSTDLIEFRDANSDLQDDNDPAIRFFDQNVDLDYYDTYTSGGRVVAEQPDTHVKRVTFEVYRRGRLVCSQTELISLEQMTGDYNPSSEAVLSLLVSTPANSAYLYSLATAGLAASWALPLGKAFPANVSQQRADASSPLTVSGETDPLASVKWYANGAGPLDSVAADAAGAFSGLAILVTGALAEGNNALVAQAVKDTYTSPLAPRSVLYDAVPPGASTRTPTGTVATRHPQVSTTLSDASPSTTVVSGVCPDVITMKVDGVEVSHSYNAATGLLVWVDSATGIAPVLANGATYSVTVELADYAGYKASAAWTFSVSVPATDNSAPSIANRDPIGMAGSQLPVISVRVFDNQSGIDPASIVMTLDGATVVDAASLAGHYDPSDGTVSYTPPAAFAASSSHSVSITASHWADAPPSTKTSSDSWTFTVP